MGVVYNIQMFETLLWIQQTPAVLLTVAALLGALIGSFLNVVIVRLPIMLQNSWAKQSVEYLNTLTNHPDITLNTQQTLEVSIAENTNISLCTPRSSCPHCHKAIAAYDNIPLLSFLWLRGHCRHCQQSISPRYFAVELMSSLLSVLSIWFFGANAVGIGACLLSYALICLTVIDFNTELLPDEITLSFMWLGLIFNLFDTFCPLPQALWGAMIGYLSLWSFYWIFKALTGKEGMGYGDFKMFALLGAWLGIKALPLILLIASITGSIMGIAMIRLFKRDRNQPIRFGPYLAIAGWVALFGGEPIIAMYLGS